MGEYIYPYYTHLGGKKQYRNIAAKKGMNAMCFIKIDCNREQTRKKETGPLFTEGFQHCRFHTHCSSRGR